MTVTKLTRAISMKVRLLVCVLWPSGTKRTGLASGGHASGSVGVSVGWWRIGVSVGW